MNHPHNPPSASPPPSDESRYRLYEVWGDTICARHLTMAIIIGAVVSLGAFGGAQLILAQLVESQQMAKAYSMLVGILGCLGGGAISAKLFKPKRDVIEDVADPGFREQVVADLLKEYGSLGRLEDVSPEVLAELKELQLYDLFLDAERRERATAAEQPRTAEIASGVAVQGGRS